MKRLFDIVFSIGGLILLSPILLIVAILIKLYMPGPVFFNQVRGGQFGKPFVIHKFRTMKVNSEGSTISVRGDTRVTPLGAILRKIKLDELPELWNVLKGDMSFVGPRPDMPEYSLKLNGEEKKILELKPGITGPATLKFFNEEELLATVPDPHRYNDDVIWPEKVKLNLQYYYNNSISLDILIIFKTIFKNA